MKRNNTKLYVGIGVFVVVLAVLLFFFGGFLQSIIKIGGNSISYSKDGIDYSYNCGSDSLSLRHNTWASQSDLLNMCKMCVLELTYPTDNPRVQMLGDCEWVTSSTTGDSRYRYRAVPLDGTACGDIKIKGDGVAENAAEVACYQGRVFNQLISWSNQVNYCPINPLSYVHSSGLGACFVPVVTPPIVPPVVDVVIVPPPDVPLTSGIPMVFWIILSVIMVFGIIIIIIINKKSRRRR